MNVNDLINITGAEFFTGVPDSQLKQLCDALYERFGIGKEHIIAANEGNAVGLAAGYHLSTGKVPVVYMQNSGLGNIVNPVASLLNNKVYGIPCIFIVGWRGEPGVHDEPQHIYQGEITLSQLDLLGIKYLVLTKETTTEELKTAMDGFQPLLAAGESVAIVVKKGALTKDAPVTYKNNYEMTRERAIEIISDIAGKGVIVSTTGKASRELFEIRENRKQGHGQDFLTVGSMGHASSIALSIALNKPEKKVWCVDGDGAALMHMGAMGVIGANRPGNLVHIVLNNEAHETVGGMPTVSNHLHLVSIAKGCGYEVASHVNNEDQLTFALLAAKDSALLTFLEVRCALGARDDLGRPTTTPKENKAAFMEYLCQS